MCFKLAQVTDVLLIGTGHGCTFNWHRSWLCFKLAQVTDVILVGTGGACVLNCQGSWEFVLNYA